MTDLAERAANIAAKARAAQPTREQNRDSDPQFAREIDGLRAMGGELVRVTFPDGRVWTKRK